MCALRVRRIPAQSGRKVHRALPACGSRPPSAKAPSLFSIASNSPLGFRPQASPPPPAPRLALSRYELVVVPRRRLNSTSGSRSAQTTRTASTPFPTGSTSMEAAYLVSGGGGPGGACAGREQGAGSRTSRGTGRHGEGLVLERAVGKEAAQKVAHNHMDCVSAARVLACASRTQPALRNRSRALPAIARHCSQHSKPNVLLYLLRLSLHRRRVSHHQAR